MCIILWSWLNIRVVCKWHVATCWPSVVTTSSSYFPSWRADSDPLSQEVCHVNVTQQLPYCILGNPPLDQYSASWILTRFLLSIYCTVILMSEPRSRLFSYFPQKSVCARARVRAVRPSLLKCCPFTYLFLCFFLFFFLVQSAPLLVYCTGMLAVSVWLFSSVSVSPRHPYRRFVCLEW